MFDDKVINRMTVYDDGALEAECGPLPCGTSGPKCIDNQVKSFSVYTELKIVWNDITYNMLLVVGLPGGDRRLFGDVMGTQWTEVRPDYFNRSVFFSVAENFSFQVSSFDAACTPCQRRSMWVQIWLRLARTTSAV